MLEELACQIDQDLKLLIKFIYWLARHYSHQMRDQI